MPHIKYLPTIRIFHPRKSLTFLELYTEEETLLKHGREDFCADQDTFTVSMTRSHNDDEDCDQWCSSMESEETCSKACHAVTGKFFIFHLLFFWNWSVNISSVVYLSNLCNKVMDHHLLFIIIHPQGSLVTGGLVRLGPPTPPPPPPWSRP